MSYKPRIVIALDNCLGIAVGTKMDPNYIITNIILPVPQEHVVIYKSNLIFTALSPSDIDGLTSFSEFQQSYPEYFIWRLQSS